MQMDPPDGVTIKAINPMSFLLLGSGSTKESILIFGEPLGFLKKKVVDYLKNK